MKFLPALLLAVCLSAPSLRAGTVTAQGGNVIVGPGSFDVGGQKVAVKEEAKLAVAPAPVLKVEHEDLLLSGDRPAGWAKGTRLKACNARDVNANGSFVPGSLEIRDAKGEVLKEGEDYLVDSDWGHVGLGPKSRVTSQDKVTASYKYSQERVDTIQVSAEGKASLKQGVPHISSPVPPKADEGRVSVAHVFVSHQGAEVVQDHIYPITETAGQALTGSTPGRIPHTLAKLKAEQAVTIVCLGDSVTAGGNASKPELRYPDVFAAGLRERFPKAAINLVNLSAGGSNSRQWLSPDTHPYRRLHGAENPARFERVLEAKPDLVTIEFVNDAGLTGLGVEASYNEILQRLGPGVEVILITPHFTMWRMMGFTEMRGTEKRPYVIALRAFAAKHNLGLADASARWEHLWKEGLPYLTLLNNTINHPDDRGHRLFAEELWKCFE